MAPEWYIRVGNVAKGPISSATLKQLALSGKLTPAMLLRRSDSNAWIPAGRVKGLFPAAPATPPTSVAATAPLPPKPVEAPPAAVEPTPEPEQVAEEVQDAVEDAAPPMEVAPSEPPVAEEPPAVDEIPTPAPKQTRKPAPAKERRSIFQNGFVQFLLIVFGFLVVAAAFIGAVLLSTMNTRPLDPLIGKWESTEKDNRLQFSTDGRLTIFRSGGEIFIKWKRADAQHIKVGSSISDSERYEAVTEGDKLAFKGATGAVETYHRVQQWKDQKKK